MTEKQRKQFNLMLFALKQISSYQAPEKLQRNSKADYGLSYTEALEMSYENVINTARVASMRIRRIKEK